MKILYNIGKFSGGAPLSILEYAKIAKKNKFDVIAIGEFKECQDKYKEEKMAVYDVFSFKLGNPVKSIAGIIKGIKIVRKEKPDVIHATSYGNVPSKFIGMLLGIPVLYTIAGGNNAKETIRRRIFKNEKLIVYSEENKMDLLRCGYPLENIKVISNRLTNNKIEYLVKTKQSGKLQALLISRLDSGLINSISKVINIIVNLTNKDNNIHLDIIGSGKLESQVRQMAMKQNNSLGKEIITVHGYQENVEDFIKDSDIVFGKGRSIIEAILHNKIGFIVGEDNKISRCSKESIPNLYKYNFSGRNIEFEATIEEIDLILKQVMADTLDYNELNAIKVEIDKLYNIKYVEEDIIDLYREKLYLANEIESQPLEAVKFLLKVYWYRIFGK